MCGIGCNRGTLRLDSTDKIAKILRATSYKIRMSKSRFAHSLKGILL